MGSLYHVLGLLLVSFVLQGCAPQPSPEARHELTTQFETVPRLPGSTEVDRRFSVREDEVILQVTFAVTEYHFKDSGYRAAFGDGRWKYKASKTEMDGHFYEKDGWILIITQEARTGRVKMLLYRQ